MLDPPRVAPQVRSPRGFPQGGSPLRVPHREPTRWVLTVSSAHGVHHAYPLHGSAMESRSRRSPTCSRRCPHGGSTKGNHFSCSPIRGPHWAVPPGGFSRVCFPWRPPGIFPIVVTQGRDPCAVPNYVLPRGIPLFVPQHGSSNGGPPGVSSTAIPHRRFLTGSPPRRVPFGSSQTRIPHLDTVAAFPDMFPTAVPTRGFTKGVPQGVSSKF
jgi:hypothetical protein